MSIVLDLKSKSLPQLSLQTNNLELIFYSPFIKKANSINENKYILKLAFFIEIKKY